ncbi:myb-like protein U isoform X2 [Oppia nitens]|nr:myb-like protein U isoform X2 [Oppia nitens]
MDAPKVETNGLISGYHSNESNVSDSKIPIKSNVNESIASDVSTNSKSTSDAKLDDTSVTTNKDELSTADTQSSDVTKTSVTQDLTKTDETTQQNNINSENKTSTNIEDNNHLTEKPTPATNDNKVGQKSVSTTNVTTNGGTDNNSTKTDIKDVTSDMSVTSQSVIAIPKTNDVSDGTPLPPTDSRQSTDSQDSEESTAVETQPPVIPQTTTTLATNLSKSEDKTQQNNITPVDQKKIQNNDLNKETIKSSQNSTSNSSQNNTIKTSPTIATTTLSPTKTLTTIPILSTPPTITTVTSLTPTTALSSITSANSKASISASQRASAAPVLPKTTTASSSLTTSLPSKTSVALTTTPITATPSKSLTKAPNVTTTTTTMVLSVPSTLPTPTITLTSSTTVMSLAKSVAPTPTTSSAITIKPTTGIASLISSPNKAISKDQPLVLAHKRSPSSPIPKQYTSDSLVRATKSQPTPILKANFLAAQKSREEANSASKVDTKRPKRKIESKTVKSSASGSSVADNSGNSDESRYSKRVRLQHQPFQSPEPLLLVPPLFRPTPRLHHKKEDDKRVVIYKKNEFLAVRNETNGYYICRAKQNVFYNSHKFKIQWFNNDKNPLIYVGDFYDVTNFECILTNLSLNRLNKDDFELPDDEKQRIQNILERAINIEKGVNKKGDALKVTADGVDVSIVGKDEEKELLKKHCHIRKSLNSNDDNNNTTNNNNKSKSSNKDLPKATTSTPQKSISVSTPKPKTSKTPIILRKTKRSASKITSSGQSVSKEKPRNSIQLKTKEKPNTGKVSPLNRNGGTQVAVRKSIRSTANKTPPIVSPTPKSTVITKPTPKKVNVVSKVEKKSEKRKRESRSDTKVEVKTPKQTVDGLTPTKTSSGRNDSRSSKRIRLQHQPFQSPEPLIPVQPSTSGLLVKKENKEKTVKKEIKDDEKNEVIYNKNEFLAVRNETNGYYICKAKQNVFKNSRKFKIQWFNNDKNPLVYVPDFFDVTDFECILTNITLNKLIKDEFELPNDEKQRINNILDKVITTVTTNTKK